MKNDCNNCGNEDCTMVRDEHCGDGAGFPNWQPLKARTIDITPTWRGLLPVFLALIESGTAEGRKTAREELQRMAEAADKFNELTKAAKV